MVTCVLLDIDGTLLDTDSFITKAFQVVATNEGFHFTPKIYKTIEGKTLEDSYRILSGREDIAALCEAHRSWQEDNVHLVRPFDDVMNFLQMLRKHDIRTAGITNRGRRTSFKTLQSSGIADMLDLLLTRDDVENLKPHPEPLLKALSQLDDRPETAVMIGDSAKDVQAGASAGLKTILVNRTSLPVVVEPAASWTVSDLSAVPKLLGLPRTR